MPVVPPAETPGDLIDSQLKFGLAYVREARTAYETGSLEYGDLARDIALNSYRAAVRFASRLLDEPDPALTKATAHLKLEIEALLRPDAIGMLSIA
jgi:hypothetical protein